MKKSAICALFAILSASAVADPADWYLPEKWSKNAIEVEVEYVGEDNKTHSTKAYLGEKGEILYDDKIPIDEDHFSAEQFNALNALEASLRSYREIERLGKNIDAFINGGEAQYTSDSGDKSNGKYSFKMGKDGKLELTLTGVAGVRAGRGLTKVNREIGLSMWGTESGADTLANVLSGKGPKVYETHDVLCRSGANGTLSYLKIGSGLGAGGGVKVDLHSVVTNSSGVIMLKNWMEEGATKGANTLTIPYVDSNGAEPDLRWGRFRGFFGEDEFELEEDNSSDKRIRLKGASNEVGAKHYFGTGTEDGKFGFFDLPNGAPCDDTSITTNGTDTLHIVGVDDAVSGQIPYADGDGGLSWDDPPPNVSYDGAGTVTITQAGANPGETTIALSDIYIEEDENGYTIYYFPLDGEDWEDPVTIPKPAAFKVDDASITTNSDHGATTDNAASLYGWSDAATGALPSKKSNGKIDWSKLDENTLSFTTLNGAPVIGFNLWNYNYSGDIPVVPANVGGVLTYVGLPPIHPPDNNSLEYVSNSGVTNLQIKGWKNQSECGANLMSMLTRSGDENRATHSILCRVGDGEGGYSLHYLPVGGGVMMDVDGHSIVTNAQDHANEAALAGFWEDETEDGMFPVKSGDTLAWVPTNSMSSAFKADGHSIVTNVPGHLGEAAIYGYWDASSAGNVLTRTAGGLAWSPVRVQVDDASISSNNNVVALYGFEGAEENMMPHKENGRLVWGGVSAVTNTILAGAGIVITDNGGGAITISADPFAVENMMNTATIVTAAKYDTDTHKFQIKTRQIVFRGTLGTESEWTDVFEATSHKGEHQAEEQ